MQSVIIVVAVIVLCQHLHSIQVLLDLQHNSQGDFWHETCSIVASRCVPRLPFHAAKDSIVISSVVLPIDSDVGHAPAAAIVLERWFAPSHPLGEAYIVISTVHITGMERCW